MKSEYLRRRAEEMRHIRLNQPRVSREAALKLFEQHRQAAKASRLSLKLPPSAGENECGGGEHHDPIGPGEG